MTSQGAIAVDPRPDVPRRHLEHHAWSTASQVLGRIVTAGAALLTVHVLTARLGPAGFGMLTAALALASTLSIGSDGLGTAASRDLALGRSTGGEALVTAMLARAVRGAVTIPGAVALSALLYRDHGPAASSMAALAAGVAAAGVADVCGALLVAQGSGTLRGALDPLRQLAILGGVLLVVHRPDAAVYAVYGVALGAAALVTVLVAMRRLGTSRERRRVLPLLRSSAPLSAVEAVNTVYLRIDGILLAILASEVTVGRYGVAYRIADLCIGLGGIVTSSLLPRLARGGDIADLIRSSRALLTCATPPVVLGGALLAGPILYAVAGPEFVPAADTVRILLVAVGVSFLVAPWTTGLVMLDRSTELLRVYAVVTVLNIAANAALIPLLGAPGAATCVVVSEAFAFLAARARVSRDVRVGAWVVLPVVPAVIAMVAVWSAVRLAVHPAVRDLAVWGPTGIGMLAAYAGVLLATGRKALR